MAFSSASEHELSCPVCLDVFQEPVLLSCSHSICKVCLQKFWKQNEERACPVCRRRSSNLDPPSNLALRNLCGLFLEKRSEETSEMVCLLHDEKIKLFCMDDKEPACWVCRDSKRHVNHNFRPISEAALDFREDLKTKLELLEEKLKVLYTEKMSTKEWLCYIKSQAQKTERQIKKEFERLYHFLQNEEASRIASLKEEEQQKCEIMKIKIEELDNSILSLTKLIEDMKAELRANDAAFLHNYRMTLNKPQCNIEVPKHPLGALIDEAKHVGNLSFRVWEKMHSVVQYTPVILDPNTAHPHAVLSEDLTSMRFNDVTLVIPDNPERFIKYNCVLGSDAISSGIHLWDVEVKDITHWHVGILTEFFRRKIIPHHPFTADHGCWDLECRGGKYIFDCAGKKSSIESRKLEKIRVHLDWDRGSLVFSDPLTGTLLHRFRCVFTERVVPYFWTNSTDNPLRVLPIEICITVKKSN